MIAKKTRNELGNNPQLGRESDDTNAASQAELQREASDVCGHQDYAERIIDRHVKQLKVSYPDLPESNLAMTVRASAPGGCACRVALHILSERLAELQLKEKQAADVAG
jgi:hypothetical protein